MSAGITLPCCKQALNLVFKDTSTVTSSTELNSMEIKIYFNTMSSSKTGVFLKCSKSERKCSIDDYVFLVLPNEYNY